MANESVVVLFGSGGTQSPDFQVFQEKQTTQSQRTLKCACRKRLHIEQRRSNAQKSMDNITTQPKTITLGHNDLKEIYMEHHRLDCTGKEGLKDVFCLQKNRNLYQLGHVFMFNEKSKLFLAVCVDDNFRNKPLARTTARIRPPVAGKLPKEVHLWTSICAPSSS